MYAPELYELEVSKSFPRCHYIDFRDKTMMTEMSVFGSQSLGAERQRSPCLAVKMLITEPDSVLASVRLFFSYFRFTVFLLLSFFQYSCMMFVRQYVGHFSY